jgi:hypothetical protein
MSNSAEQVGVRGQRWPAARRLGVIVSRGVWSSRGGLAPNCLVVVDVDGGAQAHTDFVTQITIRLLSGSQHVFGSRVRVYCAPTNAVQKRLGLHGMHMST